MTKTTAKARKTLVLLDAHAILHRAYHALPDFVSGKGEPTGGLYGLSTMLLRIIAELKPDQLIACYDLPEATFRKQLYDGYKSGRKQADDELVSQIIRSRDVFAAFNIPIYEKAGFEADDILGTIVERLKDNREWQIIIASGDMDTLQLVEGKRVTVYTLKRGLSETIIYDESAVRARFGFGPELLPDWKGLRGDPSDNIIGITGIGEKTATDLVTKFGSLEQIYQKLKKNKSAFLDAGIKERMVKLLEEGEEEALFSKTLATIRRDVPIDFEIGEKSWREGVELALIEKLFAELEFRTLGARARATLGGTGEIAASAGGGEEALDDRTKIALWLLDSNLTNPQGTDLQGRTLAELEAEIKKQGLEKVYREIEVPLIPIIERAEKRGIKVEVEILKNLSTEYHAELAELERKIHDLAGAPFNINSPKQLGEILFDKLQLSLKGLRKTAGGARSTRESELVKLKEAHPIIAEILRYRELAKLVSTYVDAIPALVNESGRLHTKLHQTGTTTGRMSSSDPNLQNIPADEQNGDRIRRAFVASPGHHWLSFDYSQIEMRVLALLSGDPELTRVFQEGSDVHTAVAARVFRVREEEVSRDQRRRAKVINFGIIYGMGVSALQRNLNSTRAEAQEFYDGYFTAFPAIGGYFEQVKQAALERGYTETYFGRRRHFPGLKSKLPQIKAMNERMAMNAPLQGTAADIVKLAMIRVDHRLAEEKLQEQVHLLLQVHDELIYEVAEAVVEPVKKLIKQEMEGVLGDSSIPLRASAKEGANWAEAE